MSSSDARPFLLLDLRTPTGGQLPDLGLCTAAGVFADAGLPVRQVRAVVPPDEAEWHRLLEWLVAFRPRAVVIERPWPADLLGALRSGTKAPILLLQGQADTTSPAFVDRALGLDIEGLRAWGASVAAGNDPPRLRSPEAAAAFAALRRWWNPRFGLETPPWESPVARSEANLLGNPTGCSYLADLRANPLFRELDLGQRHGRGCSFCLDQDGVYRHEPVGETVAFLVRQIERIAREAPTVRRLVLSDDGPLPLLAPLLETAATASLPAYELAIKLRADVLLRRSQDLRSLGAEAARLGWTIDLHCVGFESFSDRLLSLFNKGFDAATVRRAVLELHDLAATPGLRAGRSRAHGFLLWTPWTTLEDLKETARAVRNTRFAELREDWLDTRLRLQPVLPLYVKARADGLLAMSPGSQGRGYAGADVDRAVQQGYGDSVRWGYSDPRAALVERLVVRLRQAPTGGLEAPADLLERVTLAVEDLSHEAVLGALRDPTAEETFAEWLGPYGHVHAPEPWHARPVAEVGVTAPVASFGLDIELVRSGIRQAAIVERLSEGAAHRLVFLLHAGGLAAAISQTAPAAGTRAVLLARDEATLSVLADAQAAVVSGDATESTIQTVGQLLGYPSCCVAAFAAQADRGDDVFSLARALAATAGVPDGRLNPLGPRPLLAFHPCRLDCPAATAFTQRAMERLEARFGSEAAAAVGRVAAIPMLVTGERERFLLTSARWDGDTLSYGEVYGPPGPVLDAFRSSAALDATEAGLRLHGPSGTLEPVPADTVVLLSWDRPPLPAFTAQAPAAPSSGRRPPLPDALDALVDRAVGQGWTLLRATVEQDAARVAVFLRGDERLRIELRPPDSDAPTYASGPGGTMAYKVERTDTNEAIPLQRASKAATTVVADAVRLVGGEPEG